MQVVASLLALDSLDNQEEIKLYINCPQVGRKWAARGTLGRRWQHWACLPAGACVPASLKCRLLANCRLQGNPYAVTSILDTIRAIKAPVSTVGFGMVGGTAAAVLAGGTKVRRMLLLGGKQCMQRMQCMCRWLAWQQWRLRWGNKKRPPRLLRICSRWNAMP